MGDRKTYILDLETDGLLPPVREGMRAMTRLHCAAIRDRFDNVQRFMDPEDAERLEIESDGDWCDLVDALDSADRIVGHNVADFDLPALGFGGVVPPSWRPSAEVFDTLVAARMVWPDIEPFDWPKIKRKQFPARLKGRHSLEAWGFRLGVLKGDFAKTTDWKEISPEMVEYCARDTQVTALLYRMLLRTLSEWPRGGREALELEHKFAAVIARQLRYGAYYDMDRHTRLMQTLTRKKRKLEKKVKELCPGWEEQLKTKVKPIPFNPNSRAHVVRHLQERRGWEPKSFTDGGKSGKRKPKLDEEVLSSKELQKFEEIPVLRELFVVNARRAELEVGAQSYLKALWPDQRLRGFVNHNGAVTSRCTHSRPNSGNVTAITKPYGREIRSCFSVPEGFKMVGVDAAGIELRGLAHYLAPFDGGRFIEIVLDGDVHWSNSQILAPVVGMPKMAKVEEFPEDDEDAVRLRNVYAKRFIYAYLYGAGDGKLGTIVGGGSKAGKKLRAVFEAGFPGLKKLRVRLAEACDERGGKLRGLDGRMLFVRSQHSMLNTLLQSFGAIVMKLAPVFLEEWASKRWTYGIDFAQVLHVHDEIQSEVHRRISEDYAKLAVESVREAGKYLGVRCPLDAEAKIGDSWAETH